MGISIDERESLQVVTIDGELDSLEVQNIRGQLEDALQLRSGLYAIDVSDLSMVDSSGIGLLVYLYKRATADGNRLALVGLKGQPADMINFLKIDQIVPIYDSVDAAHSALRG